MERIKFIDATLRDGNHALKQQISRSIVSDYCEKIDDAGLDAVVVGHGNGLGASSLQVGIALESDDVLLKTAKEKLKKTTLGAYLIPGFGKRQYRFSNRKRYRVVESRMSLYGSGHDQTTYRIR